MGMEELDPIETASLDELRSLQTERLRMTIRHTSQKEIGQVFQVVRRQIVATRRGRDQHRPLDDQLRLECLYGYSTMGNPEIGERKQEFIDKRDEHRVTTRPAGN